MSTRRDFFRQIIGGSIACGVMGSIKVNLPDEIVSVDQGYFGRLFDAYGNEIKSMCTRANLTTGECVEFVTDKSGQILLDHANNSLKRTTVKYPAPLRFVRYGSLVS